MDTEPAPSPARIVVVEDEPTLAEAIALRLRAEGYDVDLAPDGATGLAVCDPLPDLVLLDWMLPDMDGLEVCRRLRDRGGVPILLLTARTSEQDVVAGLAAGADDHIGKPVGMRELVARVRALLRLVQRTNPGAAVAEPLVVGDVTLDAATRVVTRGEQGVHLTATEFALLRRLAERGGAVATRAALLREVWDLPEDVPSRTLDTHVAELRRKLGPTVVRTVHGVGYAAGASEQP